MRSTRLLRWLAASRIWESLLNGPIGRSLSNHSVSAHRSSHRLLVFKPGLLPLEDRITPDGRPLPLPFIFVGAATGAPPLVRAYHAETGELAFERQPFDTGFTGGVRVSAGDVNHDGIPDLIAAAGPGAGPHICVFDGVTGDQISGPLGSFYAYDSGFTGGVNVASADVDGDGWADVITAAGAGAGPHIKVFSGQTGSLLNSFYAYAPSFLGGATVAAADFTGDGRAEVVVGAGAGAGPHVMVFDLSTGLPVASPIGSFYAFDPDFTGGVDVGTDALAGDLTGDGVPDIVVGRGAGAGSLVRVFSGVTGEQVLEFSPFGSDMTAGVRVATAYVDDDRYADVIVGTGPGVISTVKVFSGLTGLELASPMGSYTPFGEENTGGVFVAGSNDPNYVSFFTISPSSSSGAASSSFSINTVVGGVGVTPSGTVTFVAYPQNQSGSPVNLGSVTINSVGPPGYGAATFFVAANTFTKSGIYDIRARYNGDSNYYPDTRYTTYTVSGTVPVLANRPGGDSGACDCTGGVASASGAGNSGGIVKTTSGVEDNGNVRVTLLDVAGDGFGMGMSDGISWSNSSGYAEEIAGGGTQIGDWGRIADTNQGNGSVALITSSTTSVNFDSSGGTFTSQFGLAAGLVLNTTTHEYTLTGGDGSTQVYYDRSSSVLAELRGKLKSKTDAAGNTMTVTSWDSVGRPLALQKTDSATGVTEQLAYTYNASGQIDTITRQRKPSGGSFTTVRSITLSYTTPSGTTTPVLSGTVEKDASGTTLSETYNRYYASGSSTGYAGALKYHLGKVATAQLKQAYSGTALSALTDSQVAAYADNYFEYDSSRRVTKASTAGAGCSACSGGLGTSTISYSTRASGSYGINEWKTKTTETLDDGTILRKYTNANGQILISAISESTGGGNTWITYTRYNSDGQIAFTAAPSAVSGYDETKADLVDYAGGSNATYLRNSDGLITTYTYGSSTTATTSAAGDVSGYLKSISIQRGETGTAVKQSETLYIARTAANLTTYHVASQSQYRNDNGTGAETVTTAYTWQGSTQQVASVTTTVPTVTSGQNGPGTAATGTTIWDNFGRAIWSKDAAGVLSYTAYDAGTGAVVKTIADVNTANTSDFANLPSGWSTPSGAGLHLISTFEVDALGRTTKSVDPLGLINYTVYNDANHEVRMYSGWNTSTNLPTGPTTVYRDDRSRGYSETLTMSATPTVSSGRPTGTESITSIQSLSRSYYNTARQNTYSDSYFDLSGVTYSTAVNIGTQNTNFYRTETAYDKKGQVNKTVSAAGTITRTENDALGRAVSTWVGTDDTPTTGVWSPTNLTGTNMVKVAEIEYDNGGVGDSNATKMTMYPGGSAANRVSQTFYDWRDRAVATKSGVETSEGTTVNRPITYTEYDNLGEVVASEVYDGDTVAIVDAGGDGVPDRPSSSLLRAKTVTSYDELGRAYKSETYSVDPSTGSVSTYALTSQVWFDIRGLTLKSTSPGGIVQKTAYDSLGRATTMYVTDGGGDSAWSDAGNVTGDTVLSQSEMTYDADGNVILSVDRERFHDATGTGSLGTPSSGIAARVSYSAAYYDKLNRLTEAVNVGTNGGSAYTRPGSVPSRSDTVLVTSVEYDAAGRQWKTVDPRGLESRTTYDLLGRTTKTIENYVDGTVSDLDDKTTEYTYSAAGMTSLTAKLTGGSGQTTEWVYGVGSSGNLYSNDIVAATKWPDPTTGASSSGQQETVTVNSLGQVLTSTDRNGSTHTLGYDVLGRVVSDAVTTLGSGVDGAVRRIETAYDGQGNAYLVTAYDAATSGSIVNQVQRAYDGLGNLTREWQSHSGAVNTSTTPSVQYGYSTLGTSNQVRLTSMTYPSGYVLSYNYSSGLNNTISRLSSLSDAGGTLESYEFLGLSTVVKRTHPGSGVDLTYIGTGTADAGDKYVGLDRFGRVVDQKWVNSSTSAVTDEFTYTYDRDSNRLTKGNAVNSAYNEVYTYDGLNQLASFNQGSGAHTQSFDYDALGNRDAVTTDSTTQTYSTNKQNEITSISGATTPTYDANGNMTTDETGKQYVYDAWNRLKIVKSSGETTLKTYGYDGMNRRVSETASGNTADLYYSTGWQVLEEKVGSNTSARYVWSPVYVDAMILRERDADSNGTLDERLYVQQDANFNVTALVNTSGSVVERYVYDPYGKATVLNASWTVLSGSAYAWQYLHQGGRVEATSGLVYFRNRDYSVTLGRWTTMDPMRFFSDTTNMYVYESNSVPSASDSTGLFDVFDRIFREKLRPYEDGFFRVLALSMIPQVTKLLEANLQALIVTDRLNPFSNGICASLKLKKIEDFSVSDFTGNSVLFSTVGAKINTWLSDRLINALSLMAAEQIESHPIAAEFSNCKKGCSCDLSKARPTEKIILDLKDYVFNVDTMTMPQTSQLPFILQGKYTFKLTAVITATFRKADCQMK